MTAGNRTLPIESTQTPPSRESSARGAFWALVDLAGGQGSSFLVFLVLARVIGPAQYGVFAIAISMIGLLTIFQYRSTGFSSHGWPFSVGTIQR